VYRKGYESSVKPAFRLNISFFGLRAKMFED
jgi:hypothetical protein